MFSVIEDQVNIGTIQFSYVSSRQLDQLDNIPPATYDIIVAFSSINPAIDSLPFRYNPQVHDAYLTHFYHLLDQLTRIATKTATLYIYGLPQWLPYFSVYLDGKGWQFKYWLALETHRPQAANLPMVRTHEGILLYVRDKNKFSLRKVRSEHQKCDVCGDFTADWGGKKHLRNPLGYAISDVWDDLPAVKDPAHVLSKEVWQRLILLTAKDNSRVLCAAYDGEQNLERFILE